MCDVGPYIGKCKRKARGKGSQIECNSGEVHADLSNYNLRNGSRRGSKRSNKSSDHDLKRINRHGEVNENHNSMAEAGSQPYHHNEYFSMELLRTWESSDN